VARCTGQQAYLTSWSPAPGFHADDVLRGPGAVARLTFDNGPQGVEVQIHCVANVPQVSVGPDT
jgi:hypothetical protein